MCEWNFEYWNGLMIFICVNDVMNMVIASWCLYVWWCCEYGTDFMTFMGMSDVVENINCVKWCNILEYMSNVFDKIFVVN